MRNTENACEREIADRLTLLLGYHQMLLDGAMGALVPAQQQALADLLKCSERLVELFREMTTLVRSGELHVSCGP